MQRVSTERRILALLLATGLLLSGCSGPEPDDGGPASTEQRGPQGTVPAGLEKFYGQSLTWGGCAPYASTTDEKAAFSKRGLRCARLTVPQDYADPAGKTITLGLLRKAAAGGDRIGSLLMNPGGPGGSGMVAAAGQASLISNTELATRFDLVGFDPRGIGASEPKIKCLSDSERDAERRDLDLDTSPEGVRETEQENQDYVAKCVEHTGKDFLANVGSRDVAKDMDIMRSALGDQKLTYLGYSYGTRIGTAYAEQFPQNVRALILDGAVAPSNDPITELVNQNAGFQKAFTEFATWCAAQSSCALGGDPAQATKRYREIVTPLIEKPLQFDGRTFSYTDAQTALVQALYAKDYWTVANTGLADLKKGNPGKLLVMADQYYSRDAKGHYSTQNDAFTAIRCVDDPRVTDPAQLLEADKRAREAAPFLDDGGAPAAVRDYCAFWPVPNTSQPHQPNVPGLPSTLVISTTGDPATPYQAGVDLAAALKARLLTYTGTQHTIFLQGNKCVDDLGSQYLIDLKLPAQGAKC
ncbi:alpha/beta hydrolase [Pseudonocardiaceae bacterium YIM PH 21723]|nr:alpha/beta hydrolase [Pseudonocardiaceae bacterium YIM PH 21723]